MEVADISNYNLCLTLLSLLKKNIKKKKKRGGLRFIVLIVAVTVVVLGTDLDDSVGSLEMVCWYMLLDWPFSNYLNFSNFPSVSIKQNSASMNSINIICFI